MEKEARLRSLFLFWHIVKITVIAHYPTAIAPEGVFVPLSLGVLLPLLTVALINPYAGLIVQVNTHRHLFVLHDERERLTLLHHGQFCRTQFQFILQHLQVAPDDRRRYRHHLIGLRVNLHESLAAPAISILTARIGKSDGRTERISYRHNRRKQTPFNPCRTNYAFKQARQRLGKRSKRRIL